MPRKLDPKIAEILKAHSYGAEACWDCHGVWVVYHKVLEEIAAQAEISFSAPLVLEANGPAKSVALCVTGTMGGRCEWSIGEASPANNKNSYPYAMAEKRGKDRVILKLIGLAGLAYSEEEADSFKGAPPAANDAPARSAPVETELWQRIAACQWSDDVTKLMEAHPSANDDEKEFARNNYRKLKKEGR